jgi:hypothetical protein
MFQKKKNIWTKNLYIDIAHFSQKEKKYQNDIFKHTIFLKKIKNTCIVHIHNRNLIYDWPLHYFYIRFVRCVMKNSEKMKLKQFIIRAFQWSCQRYLLYILWFMCFNFQIWRLIVRVINFQIWCKRQFYRKKVWSIFSPSLCFNGGIYAVVSKITKFICSIC